jgi:hypothetical protein
MTSDRTGQRKGYRYKDVFFSEDGTQLHTAGRDYSEVPFSDKAARQFRILLALVLLVTFPGIPLLAHWGLHAHLIWIALVVCGIFFWAHGRIHACQRCGGRSRSLSTPHMNSPVLYLCERCRTFFEHGEIDGGWPGK